MYTVKTIVAIGLLLASSIGHCAAMIIKQGSNGTTAVVFEVTVPLPHDQPGITATVNLPMASDVKVEQPAAETTSLFCWGSQDAEYLGC